jgi:hypothetical protein
MPAKGVGSVDGVSVKNVWVNAEDPSGRRYVFNCGCHLSKYINMYIYVPMMTLTCCHLAFTSPLHKSYLVVLIE